MTKLRIISDTHFDANLNGLEKNSKKGVNHSPFGSYFGKKLKEEKDCVTLIAGDLASSLENTNTFLKGFFENQPVIFIDGNHIVYQRTEKTIYELKDELRENFPLTHAFWHYLENSWMWIPGTNNTVAIIGSTFYTDYKHCSYTVEDYNERQAAFDKLFVLYGLGNPIKSKPLKRLTKKKIFSENLLSAEELHDFQWGLEEGNTHITPLTYLHLHEVAKEKVMECYKEITSINPKAKVILMTHHCLSAKCIDSKYSKDFLNASYVSDLEKWVEKMPRIRLVVSGHVHGRKDFVFGKKNIRYIVNPCGYTHRNEPFKDVKFNPNFIIDTDNL